MAEWGFCVSSSSSLPSSTDSLCDSYGTRNKNSNVYRKIRTFFTQLWKNSEFWLNLEFWYFCKILTVISEFWLLPLNFNIVCRIQTFFTEFWLLIAENSLFSPPEAQILFCILKLGLYNINITASQEKLALTALTTETGSKTLG